jgi:CheY-like chemotaxis protein
VANNLLTGKTILVVEDEMLIMMLAEDYLHQMGCTSILVAGTTRQALDTIADHDIDAAMVDMNLHGETSDAVADALSDKGVPFLFVTGYVSPSLAERHTHRHILNKPYAAGQLSALFADLLSENDQPVAP